MTNNAFPEEICLTGGNLELYLSESGNLGIVRTNGDNIPIEHDRSLVYLRDMGRGRSSGLPEEKFTPVEMSIDDSSEKGLSLKGISNNFRIDCNLISEEGYISVSGTLTSVDRKDRAAILRFSLPFQVVNARWYDSLSKSRVVDTDEVYSNWFKLGDERFFSQYPYSSLAFGSNSVSYAIPLNSPRIFRIGCSEKDGYFIEFDLGMSEDTEKFPSSASFSFIIFSTNTEWGLRAAANKYFSFFPELFRKRNTREGIWFAWNERNLMKWPLDFGLMFDSTCDETIFFDAYYGINFFYYQEPYGSGIGWGDRNSKSSIPENISYDVIIKKIKDDSLAKEKEYPTLRGNVNYVDTALKSAIEDENGLLSIGRYKPYFFSNPDPELSLGRFALDRAHFWEETTPQAARQFYGEYLDSIVPWWWSLKEDYKREHFRTADVPLVFSYKTGRPVRLGILEVYELFSEISRRTHDYGGLMLGNTWAPVQTFCAHLFDIIGAGEYTTDQPAEHFHYLRGLSFHKTLSFIDPGLVEGNLNEQEIEKRFNKCLAFGVFPGTYPFRDPGKYERLRHFYKKYIPLTRLVSDAGWEPVTYASASHTALNVERFGTIKKNLFFTILNTSDSVIDFTLDVDMKSLGIDSSMGIYALDVLNDSSAKIVFTAQRAYIPMHIERYGTLIVQIGAEQQFLASKLKLETSSIESLEKHRTSEELSENMLRTLHKLAPGPGKEFIYSGKIPDIDSLKMENKKTSTNTVLRLPWKIEKGNTDYICRVDYRTEPSTTGNKGIFSIFNSLLYSVAKFLSGDQLPDVTLSAAFLNKEGKLLVYEKSELQPSKASRVIEKRFFAPAGTANLTLVFGLEGEFSRIYINDVRVYPAGLSSSVEYEMKTIDEINNKISDFYRKQDITELINSSVDGLYSGKEDTTEAKKRIIEAGELLKQHEIEIANKNRKLPVKNESVEEYIMRLNDLIDRLDLL
ncbi:MAG: hypothetical protein HZA77_08060 [Candidatus Schekmanbacteria bacterium]|nr:hypothetical protein [Candidatus Schekmanbacteria bacterium]